MTNKKLYNYRKENGLCVNCGEILDGGTATRCLRCAQIERVKAHERYERLSPEEKAKKRQRECEWRKRNPEKVAIYKSRQVQYNKKYREGFK